MCLIWGLPYLFIRVVVEDDHLTPGTLVFVRTGLGAAILLPIGLLRSQIKPVLVRWRWLAVFAVVEIMLPWLMLSDAERHLNSSLAGLLVAAVPLVGAVAALFTHAAERLNRLQVVGLLLGIVGVACLVGLDFSGLHTSSLLEMAGVAVCYAIGPIILARSLSDLPGLGVIACALAISAVAYSPFAFLQPPHHVTASVLGSVIVLGVVCTALAFVLFFQLIATIGPTRSTIITYVNPAVAIALGVLILDEKLTPGMLVGFPLILAGSILGARKAKAKPEPITEVDCAETVPAS